MLNQYHDVGHDFGCFTTRNSDQLRRQFEMLHEPRNGYMEKDGCVGLQRNQPPRQQFRFRRLRRTKYVDFWYADTGVVQILELFWRFVQTRIWKFCVEDVTSLLPPNFFTDDWRDDWGGSRSRSLSLSLCLFKHNGNSMWYWEERMEASVILKV